MPQHDMPDFVCQGKQPRTDAAGIIIKHDIAIHHARTKCRAVRIIIKRQFFKDGCAFGIGQQFIPEGVAKAPHGIEAQGQSEFVLLCKVVGDANNVLHSLNLLEK